MPDNANPAAPVQMAGAERQALALALWKQCGSYRKIAEQLSGRVGISDRYTASAAYADLIAALKRLNERTAESADEVRRLELERLDDLHVAYWQRAVKGVYAALDRVVERDGPPRPLPRPVQAQG